MCRSSVPSCIPLYLNKKWQEQLKLPHSCDHMAADSGSTLIESARGKKYGGLDLSLLPRADRGTWNTRQIAVSRLQSISPKCIREQVMEGVWGAEGGSEVTRWRGVNIAPKNNNRDSSFTSGDSWFIFRCKWAFFFWCSWKVPPFF